ncbi:MAG: diguanylate cyclase [Sphaerochaetaceae bacterium]|nr:diguanylate cyclase [Sphaerochaetaceae bacterium]MDD3163519.1 diguanylate cyclase [Sphaerochaetaceae bacterium]MDD4008035.1 diguanylate cyclase [Sphaerochaetaceae bacterium]MDD4397412.1 diguanylate cyclase [Sphaerochaetaceae bacterium]
MEKKPIAKIVLFASMVVAILTIFVSIIYFSDLDSGETFSYPAYFRDGWVYVTSEDDEPITTTLPNKISISKNGGFIRLSNKLPDYIDDKDYLALEVSFQECTVSIDGQQRSHYGDANASQFDYPFRNSENIVRVPLYKADRGKDVTILLQSPHTLAGDFSRVHDVFIGNGMEMTVKSMLTLDSNLFLVYLVICFLVVLICMYPTIQKSVRHTLSFFIIDVFLFDCLYATSSEFFGIILGNSEKYGAVCDTIYYVIDQLIPVVSFAAISLILSIKNRIHVKILFAIHIALFASSMILHILKLQSVNIMRPYLMAYSFIIFLIQLRTILKVSRTSPYKTFVHLIVLLLSCYYIDYIRYAIMILPATGKLMDFITLDIPLEFFLGIGLLASIPIMMYSMVKILRDERMDLLDKINRDVLTGVFSRNVLMDDLVNFQQSEGNWNFAILDIDNFKRVNDTYGHLIGDQVLCIIANILNEMIPECRVYRFGGDEFCFIFECKHPDKQKEAFMQFRKELALDTSRLVSFNVSVSIGVASVRGGLSTTSIIGAADHSLYVSKQTKDAITIDAR